MIRVFTVKEAAVLLKTTAQQIRKMIQSGELPAVKVGRSGGFQQRIKYIFNDLKSIGVRSRPPHAYVFSVI